MRSRRPAILACVALSLTGLFLPLMVSATPANKKAFAKEYGDYLPEALDTCATCHVRAEAHGAESLKDFPHNAFGKALATLGEEMDLRERLNQIADEDSDADGATNLEEILAGFFPGKTSNTPSKAQLAGLDEKRAGYEAFANRYAWKPFDPVQRPELPDLQPSNADWVRNPIDAFVAAQHEARGLSHQPEASPHVLLRRVHLDLTGLSPRPEEVQAFEAAYARDPKALEKVVDKLLDSPAYGERWGRHWMDVWRYSDWAGYKDQLRDSQRHIWHWRDWIIEALNEDKPYSRMIQEMLAADELVPEDSDALRATGYLARNYHRTNRDQWMDNVVKHTSQAFMGVTMGCVKCHDHMYDPIPQTDYYAMRAIFEPYQVRTDRVPGELDRMKAGLPRAYDASLDPKTYLFERGDERAPVKDNPIAPAVPEALGGSLDIQPVSLTKFAYQPDRRPFVLEDVMAEADERIDGAKHPLQAASAEASRKALEAVLKTEAIADGEGKDSDAWKTAAKQALQLQRDADLAAAKWKVESGKQAQAKAEASLAKAQEDKNASAESKAKKDLSAAKKTVDDGQKQLAAAEKALKEELTTKFKPREMETYPKTSTGRRLAFANWLIQKENPLTARVAMNHIWLRHFGEPIVPTVAEFGGNGREPTHPALLDWMAAEFMDRGWSMKEMHKLICTSATYRQASTGDSACFAKDPDNLYLWRMHSRRMEGEIVRDNLLWIARSLDSEMGGPEVDNNAAQTSKRRSIYFRHAHEKLVEFVQIFDGPKVEECYMREESVQPHQALALANSQLAMEQAELLATRLAESTKDDAGFIESAFLEILSRHPLPEEVHACETFLNSPTEEAARAQRNLVLVLFNHNDFVTIR